MNKPPNWERVKEIFGLVLEVEPENRSAFLAKICGSDDILRGQVESWLADYARSTGFIESAPTSAKTVMANGSPDIGRRFGNYRIIREIGHGGMGAVFLAERTDGEFEQRIALKIVRQSIAESQVLGRFRRERQILASLNHPNIARLLDGGVSELGEPFLAMEFIDGHPITGHAVIGDLNVEARLRLFLKVCSAVQYAHSNLVVHRDIKPCNILVTGDGEPKLLDFGLAKIVGDAEANLSQTKTAFRALTPAYASPEQLKGEPITTATDIFSLGVVLYEILTSERPYQLDGKSLEEMIRTVTTTVPTLPSRITGGGRKFNDDLDNIVLKALSDRPERRYQTVEQFAIDIENYLAGLPVGARSSTAGYRARKFLGRHRVGAAAAALVLISLLGGTSAALWQARLERTQARIAVEQKELAEAETKKARAEEEKAEKITDFMAKIISYANPSWYAEGGKTRGEAKVIDVLNEMGERIDDEFRGQPDIQAELHHKFAEVYEMINEPTNRSRYRAIASEKAIYHAQRALDLRQQYYGEHHELVAKDLFYLAEAGPMDHREKAKMLARAIKMMRETNPDNLNLPYMLSDYAARLSAATDLQIHEIYLRAADPQVRVNNYELAEKYFNEALDLYRKHYSDENIAIIQDECNLAFVLAKLGRAAEAQPHYRSCKNNINKFEGHSHDIVVARTEKLLGIIYQIRN